VLHESIGSEAWQRVLQNRKLEAVNQFLKRFSPAPATVDHWKKNAEKAGKMGQLQSEKALSLPLLAYKDIESGERRAATRTQNAVPTPTPTPTSTSTPHPCS
jgi:hypothetical protein